MSSTPPASNNGGPTDSNTPSKCSKCKKSDIALKRCAKCQTSAYCNRECQTADWKIHKKECSLLAAARSAGSNGNAPSGSGTAQPKRLNAKPFTAIYNNKFLHDRTEKETFNILIDVLRMKQEDTYAIEGDTMVGTIYDGEENSIPAFRTLLKKAANVKGLLPPWWSGEKAAECIAYGARTDHNFSLSAAQEKSDIQEKWKDPQMLMKLRMLGEKIYGRGPGGQPGAAMLSMMMAQEGGSSGMASSHIDMAQMLGGLAGRG